MESDNKDIERQDDTLQRKGTLNMKSYTNMWQKATSLIQQREL